MIFMYPLFVFQHFKSLKMALVFLYGVLNCNYFHILSVETFALGAKKNFLIETVLLSTQNIYQRVDSLKLTAGRVTALCP